jgi:hypothetical protein
MEKINSMENEFIPYELALRMKALGFDEPCFGYFLSDRMFIDAKITRQTGDAISSPTWQSAFRWFREKYNLNFLVAFDKYICEIDDEELENPYFTYYYSINELWAEGKDYDKFTRGFINVASNRDMLSHEEAELACLEKLIEIVGEEYEKEKRFTYLRG